MTDKSNSVVTKEILDSMYPVIVKGTKSINRWTYPTNSISVLLPFSFRLKTSWREEMELGEPTTNLPYF